MIILYISLFFGGLIGHFGGLILCAHILYLKKCVLFFHAVDWLCCVELKQNI